MKVSCKVEEEDSDEKMIATGVWTENSWEVITENTDFH